MGKVDAMLYWVGDNVSYLEDKEHGKKQIMVFADYDDVTAYGDAQKALRDYARGGNDVLTAGSYGTENWLYGDAAYMWDWSKGGNDRLTGGSYYSENHLFGDAHTMEDETVGGNDTHSDAFNAHFSGDDIIPPTRSIISFKFGKKTIVGNGLEK